MTILFLISLLSECVSNDKPYIVSYEDNLYLPMIKYYQQKDFGGEYSTVPNYRFLNQKWKKESSKNWMIFPPIPYGPLEADLSLEGFPPYPPSFKHWLGTDAIGRDVLARLLYGFRICMLFSLGLTFSVILLAVLIGGLQGFLGGKWDFVLRHCIEVWSTLPLLYVVMLLGSFFGRSFTVILLILAAFSWISLSYYMRSEFLKLKSMSFIKAAKLMNVSATQIFMRHIIPNALTPVITFLPFLIVGGIGSLTALDFLGFGLNPPTPSWGEMMQQGLKHLYAPWISLSVIILLLATLLMIAFVGESLREAFNPRK